MPIADGSKRLLGYLAVHDGVADRSRSSGALWPDLPQSRASGNLRTCVWRIRSTGLPLIDIDPRTLRLSDEVEVDLARLTSAAQGVLEGVVGDGWASWRELVNAGDVLEGWSEEWLDVPREHFRQLRLQALESLAHAMARSGHLGQALECAQAVLVADPYRESAHAIAIGIHMQQGNRSEAARQYRVYCSAMRSELGLSPARDLYDLVSAIGLSAEASVGAGLPRNAPT